MLFSIFRNSSYDFRTKITLAIFSVIIVLFSLTIHEVSHGLMARALGDPTAKERGRLTLNPLKHLNPIGTISMLLFGFGWAEPVPINPNYFKNRKLGMAVTALAGPLSNFLLAFIALFADKIVLNSVTGSYEAYSAYLNGTSFLSFLDLFLYMMCIMNIALMVFNLLPIPPLDGSRILFIFLPSEYYFKVMRYEQYFAIALIALVFILPRFTNIDIFSTVTTGIMNGMWKVISLVI